MTSDLSIKISEYRANHPETKNLSVQDVANKMLKEGLVTEKDVNEQLPQLISQSAKPVTNEDVVQFSTKNSTQNNELMDFKKLLSDVREHKIQPTQENIRKLHSYIRKMSAVEGDFTIANYKKVNGTHFYDDMLPIFGHERLLKIYSNLNEQRKQYALYYKGPYVASKDSGENVSPQMRVLNDFDANIADLIRDKIKGNDLVGVNNFLMMSADWHDDLISAYPNLLTDINRSNFNSNLKAQYLANILNKLANSPLNAKQKEAIANSDLSLLKDMPDYKTAIMQMNSDNKQDKIDGAVELLRSISKCTRLQMYGNSLGISSSVSQPNGVVDDVPVKSGSINDCGFAGTVIALNSKPKGKKLLNSMLTLNGSGNSVDVKLKSENEPRTVTTDEVFQRSDMTSGDGDVRAIEIACDRHIADEAKKDAYPMVDVNMMPIDQAFKLIVGNGKSLILPLLSSEAVKNKFYDGIIQDFNNENKVFGFGFHNFCLSPTLLNELRQTQLTDTTGTRRMRLVSSHTYVPVGTDDKNIFIKNSANSTYTFALPKETFKKFNPVVVESNLE